jgi:hypothetical protein
VIVEVRGVLLERDEHLGCTPQEQRKGALGTYALTHMIEESQGRRTAHWRTWRGNKPWCVLETNDT